MAKTQGGVMWAGRFLGELVVIVFGVWIALWGEGLAEDRREREVETARLRAMATNVGQTLRGLRETQEAAAGARNALRELLVLRPPVTDSAGASGAIRYGLFYVPKFMPELNVYEDLKSSGELALLTDPRLREALSAMDVSLEAVAFAQRDIETVQQINFDRFLLDRLDLAAVLFPELAPDRSTSDPYSGLDVIGTTELRNFAAFKLDLIRQTEEELRRAEERLVAVERLISEQLQLPEGA